MYKRASRRVIELAKRFGSQGYRNRKQRLQFGKWRDDLYFAEWRLGFITVPKAANTSLKYSLLEALPQESRDHLLRTIELSGDRQAIHGAFRDSVYSTSYDQLTSLDVDNILVTTRRPEERLRSFYFDKIIGNGWPPEMQDNVARLYGIDKHTSFDVFVAKVADIPDNEAELHFRSMRKIIGARVLADPRLRLIRTEFFDSDFSNAFAEIGLPIRSSIRENALSSSGFQISQKIQKLIERRFEDDYELFY